MKKNGYNQLKQKCNIRVEKSARIIGVTIYFIVDNWRVRCIEVKIGILCNLWRFFFKKVKSETVDNWLASYYNT